MIYERNRRHYILRPSHAALLMSFSAFCARERFIMLLRGTGTVVMLLPLVFRLAFLTSEINNFDKAGYVGDNTRSRYIVSFYWLVAAEAFAFFSLLFSWFAKGTWAPSLRISRIVQRAELPSAIRLRLMNSALLLSSSVTITYSHLALTSGILNASLSRLVYTITLRCLFLRVQWVEFSTSALSISDRFTGSILFASLRFHGIHVLVRVIFLIIAIIRLISRASTPHSHPTYLSAVIYWHFVDVVWVFVYFSFYLAL